MQHVGELLDRLEGVVLRRMALDRSFAFLQWVTDYLRLSRPTELEPSSHVAGECPSFDSGSLVIHCVIIKNLSELTVVPILHLSTPGSPGSREGSVLECWQIAERSLSTQCEQHLSTQERGCRTWALVKILILAFVFPRCSHRCL